MKIKNRTYKNFLFYSLIFLSGIYAVLIAILIKDLLQSCFIKLAEIMALSNTGDFFYAVLSVPEFLISFLGLLLLLYLSIRIAFATFSVYLDFLKTKEFVNSISKVNRGEYIELKTSKDYLFTFGLLNPEIYISTSAIKKLSKKELHAVLYHERFHVLSKDPLKELFFRFIKRSVPKIVLPQTLFEKYDTAVELSADEFSFENTGTQKYLISSLIKILSFEHNYVYKSFAGEVDRVKILTRKSGLGVLKTVIIFVCAILFSIFTTVSVSATRPFNQCKDYDVCMQKSIENIEDTGNEKCVVFEYVNGSFEIMSRELVQNK